MIPWSLTALSATWGLLALLAFRRFTDRASLRTTVNRIYAHLLEIRLFSDELSLVWIAQKALLMDNLRFLALIARPALIMAVPFALLFPQLDAIYGWAPLEIGSSAILTVQLLQEPATGANQYLLSTPPGITIESPPVRNFAEHQVTWQIRPLTTVRGTLRVTFPEGIATRTIAAGSRTLFPNHRLESSVEINYPRTDVRIAGFDLPWLAWFVIISTLGAAGGVCFGLVRSNHPRQRVDERIA